MKVLWIVLASIAGLFLLLAIALAILVPRALHGLSEQARNPAEQRAVAAKVAHFTLPPGYSIGTALDLGLNRSVTIHNAARTMDVQLQTSTVPTDDQTGMQTMLQAFRITAKMMLCDLHDAAEDPIAISGKTYRFEVMECNSKFGPIRVEFGIVPGTSSPVRVMATSVRAPFDTAGFHALLGSF